MDKTLVFHNNSFEKLVFAIIDIVRNICCI